MKRLRVFVWVVSLVLLSAVGGCIIAFWPASLHSSARRAWKEKSIQEIAARVADPAWPSNELARLKLRGSAGADDYESWLSERIIVTRSGEWLAYANRCQKQDRRVRDIFLARGSDGRWYYSTYHFCIEMVVLRMDDQSADLAGFAKTYFLRTFDGRSDDCLQQTWPPAAVP